MGWSAVFEGLCKGVKELGAFVITSRLVLINGGVIRGHSS